MFVAKVRNGFTPHLRARLLDEMRGLTAARCPFANLPTGPGSHWGQRRDARCRIGAHEHVAPHTPHLAPRTPHLARD